jgi:hypothetical protein
LQQQARGNDGKRQREGLGMVYKKPRFQGLPWQELLQSAGLAIVIFVAADYLLAQAVQHWIFLQRVFQVLLSPGITLITLVVVGMGLGALGVYSLERLYSPHLYIGSKELWGLLLCLLLLFLTALVLPIPGLFLSTVMGQQQAGTALLGMTLGIFWKGRSYNRWLL